MLLRLEHIQLALHVLGCGFIAVRQHVLQTRDSQSGQVVTQPGDIADSVGAIDELVEAGPANKGEDSREEKNGPKAQCQLHVDADIRKSAVHKIS